MIEVPKAQLFVFQFGFVEFHDRKTVFRGFLNTKENPGGYRGFFSLRRLLLRRRGFAFI